MKKLKTNKLKIVVVLIFLLILTTPKESLASDFKIDSDGVITDYIGSQTVITIPDKIMDGTTEIEVTGIADYAFCPDGKPNQPIDYDRMERLNQITEITISGKVDYIGQYAFACLESLSALTINDGVGEIGKFAFYLLPELTNITIPGSVEIIGTGAFSECEYLEEIVVEEGVKVIADKAFELTTSLKSITLPESVTTIVGTAFNLSSQDFKIIAPQYKSNNTDSLSETVASQIAKQLGDSTSVTYEPTNFGITLSQPVGGTIKVNKKVVNVGETVEVTVTENLGYELQKITYTDSSGTKKEATGNQITMPASNITITAELKQQTYDITSTAGENGTITPLGVTPVLKWGSQTYTITPNSGYTIENLKIDGVVQAEKSSTYTFNNVTEPHTIEVTFKQIEYYTLTTNISNIIETTISKPENQSITIKTGTTNFLSWVINGLNPQNSRNFNFLMPTNEVEITYTYSEPNYNTTTVEKTPTINSDTASITLNQSELSSQISITESDTIEIKVEEVGSENEVKVTIPKTNLNEIKNKANIDQLKIETAVGTLSIQKDALNTIVSEASGSEVTITIKECELNELTEIQKEAVGDRPVYKFEIESNGNKITEFNGNIVVTVPYTLKSGENQNGITVYYIDGSGNTEEMNTIYKNKTVSFTTRHFSEYFIRNIIEEQKEQEENRPDRPIIPNRPGRDEDESQEEDEEDQIIPDQPKDEETKPTTSKKKKKKKTETKVEEVVVEEEQIIAENTEEPEIKLNFTDVLEDGWYVDAIKYAVKNNIAKGTSETTFSPNDPITRGQAITMLCKTYNIQEETTGENFIDAGNTYYTGYILALKNKKLLGGVGNNKVEPKKEITREELIVMLYKLMEHTNNLIQKETKAEEITVPTYKDENQIASWAKESVNYFIQNKIIVGNNGKINPKGKTTRAEMVQIIYNLNKEK